MKIINQIRTVSSLLFFSFILVNNSVYSQDIIAKFKYEEAEAAFEKGDYQTTIDKIDEVETILKTTSPKTLYLKIVSQYKLEIPSISVIESLTKNSKYYLNSYSQVEGIEEKYREVYKISEDVKKYPKTEIEYRDWIEARKKQASDQQTEKQKTNQGLLIAEKLNNYNFNIDGIKLGIDLSEVPYSTWNYLDRATGTIWEIGQQYGWKLNRRSLTYAPKFKTFKIKSSEGLSALWVDADTKKVIFVSSNLLVGGISSLDAARAKYEVLSNKLKDQFGAENVKEEESTTQTGKNSSIYLKTIKLPESAPFVISYTLSVMNYGGVLGSEVTVYVSLSVPNLTSK